MAREWIDPASGTQFLEDGTKTYIHPAAVIQFQEDQAIGVPAPTKIRGNRRTGIGGGYGGRR